MKTLDQYPLAGSKAAKRNPRAWVRVQWHGNHEEPYSSWECWQFGNVILHPGQWPSEGWSYCASFGANSERSHSGFLKGFVALDSAKQEIERLYSIGKF